VAKEKSRYNDPFLEPSTRTNTTKTTPEDTLLHKQHLQEGNSAQTLSSLDHRF
jgi:hypothetical protein